MPLEFFCKLLKKFIFFYFCLSVFLFLLYQNKITSNSHEKLSFKSRNYATQLFFVASFKPYIIATTSSNNSTYLHDSDNWGIWRFFSRCVIALWTQLLFYAKPINQLFRFIRSFYKTLFCEQISSLSSIFVFTTSQVK